MPKNGKKFCFNSVIDVISSIFLPIVYLFTAVGVLMGVVTILTTAGVLSVESDTYLVLGSMARSLFYFLPMLLAVTASKKFGANPFVALVIAGVLLFPELSAALETGRTLRFFGLPLRGVTYHSSVVPMILSAWFLARVERLFNKILPEIVKGFLTPLFSILIVGTAALLVFGPAWAVIGDGLAVGYEFVHALSPVVAGLVVGTIIQPLVMFGLGWAILLIGLNNIAVGGVDTVMALLGPAVIAQAGAAFAVMLKSKDKVFRGTCAPAGLSALLGITEPAIFGVNLPRKKPMAVACIGGGIGGAVAGLAGAEATIFVFPSLVTLPVFMGERFALYVLSYIISFGIAFGLTLMLKFNVDIERNEINENAD